MPACGDCAKLFLPSIWNGFMHTSISLLFRIYPPYRNHLNELIRIPPPVSRRHLMFCHHTTKNLSSDEKHLIKLFMNIEWRSDVEDVDRKKWYILCFKNIYRVRFRFLLYKVFANVLHVYEIFQASFLLVSCKNDDSWPQQEIFIPSD